MPVNTLTEFVFVHKSVISKRRNTFTVHLIRQILDTENESEWNREKECEELGKIINKNWLGCWLNKRETSACNFRQMMNHLFSFEFDHSCWYAELCYKSETHQANQLIPFDFFPQLLQCRIPNSVYVASFRGKAMASPIQLALSGCAFWILTKNFD